MLLKKIQKYRKCPALDLSDDRLRATYLRLYLVLDPLGQLCRHGRHGLGRVAPLRDVARPPGRVAVWRKLEHQLRGLGGESEDQEKILKRKRMKSVRKKKVKTQEKYGK